MICPIIIINNVLIPRKVSSVKCFHTKHRLFNWTAASRPGKTGTVASTPQSSSCSSASNLRAASSPTSTPPPSPSRSRSPRTPRTPRSSRAPRVPQLGRIPSPERDRPPAGSPRATRVDTPPRSRRQYHCRNQGCGDVFSIVRWRNNHETNTCQFRAQNQVVLPLKSFKSSLMI